MAEALEEKPRISHQFDSAKIFNTIKQFGKLREEQFQEFLKKQSEESKTFLGQCNESSKSNEQNFTVCSDAEEIPNVVPAREDASCSSLGNDFNDTLQESSITGHLQRCFEDSSQDNRSLNPSKVSSVPEKIPIFSEIRNIQFLKKYVNDEDEGLVKGTDSNGQPIKKRPFLKKGTGLLRFTTKGAAKIKETRLSKPDNPSVKTTKLPQKKLNLKPAIRKTDVPSERIKHIRFDVPLSDQEKDVQYIASSTLPTNSKLVENVEVEHSEGDESPNSKSVENEHSEGDECCAPSPSSAPLQEDYSDREVEEQGNVGNERKDLAEFEMLENCAQNSSFNSDSSFLQRIIHGDSNKVVSSSQKEHETVKSNMNPAEVFGLSDGGNTVVKKTPESSTYTLNLGFDKCHKEIQARKEELNKVIADIKPRLMCLGNEITGTKRGALVENGSGERFRTPSEERVQCSSSPESNECFTDSHISPTHSFPGELGTQSHSIKNVDNIGRHQANCESFSEDEEELTSQVPDDLHVNERTLVEKSIITEKLIELQNEIEKYQQLNASLSTKDTKRNEFIRKLQKERDDFEKYKESERKKLEAEIKEERRQIKRQKESFTRLQKLSKDHPTRKEREELNALRHEIEKLQEELKRQHLRYSSDSRKWKNRIDVAETERDSLRLENIKLEEQCQDLLAALKPRMKKRSESKFLNCEGDSEMQGKISNGTLDKKHAETQTDEWDLSDLKKSNQVTAESSNVNNNFKVVSECDKNDLEIPMNDIDGTQHSNKSCTPRNDNVTVSQKNLQNMTKNHVPSDLSVITVSTDGEFHEVKYGNRIERIHTTGQREIIFNSGTRKLISDDRKSITFYFYNGDVKEVHPDKQEIYRYVSGITETTFPDGNKIMEFPNGQTQHYYPGGKKEIKFPDGSCQVIDVDGTEKIQYVNGQVEIRTAASKRREFPDGHIRIIYKDGKQETRYPDGRVKLKDKDGKIIFDTKYEIRTTKTC